MSAAVRAAKAFNRGDPKLVAARVFQARDVAAADTGVFMAAPTSDP
jgi:hypothetical protein